ncbi:MAG TPA: hypothetical protein VFP84_28950 [Kofleriaceae bacterium]|nr:hypothetical protein [Kofleriaceae bacterium]
MWIRLVMLPTLALVGCVIPPSLSIGEDAGINSPPAVLSVAGDQQALPEPGPVTFDVGRTAGNLSVSMIDTDVTDTLYVRIFVDYNTPNRLDARVRCPPSSTGTAQRTVTCNLSTLCTDDDVNVQRNMTVVVFDREPLEDGSDPAFQALPAGGLSTSRFYFLRCQPRQQ